MASEHHLTSLTCLLSIMHTTKPHVIVRSGGCSGGGSSDVSRRGSDAARGELEIAGHHSSRVAAGDLE